MHVPAGQHCDSDDLFIRVHAVRMPRAQLEQTPWLPNGGLDRRCSE